LDLSNAEITKELPERRVGRGAVYILGIGGRTREVGVPVFAAQTATAPDGEGHTEDLPIPLVAQIQGLTLRGADPDPEGGVEEARIDDPGRLGPFVGRNARRRGPSAEEA
jgi:hypothetical protein